MGLLLETFLLLHVHGLQRPEHQVLHLEPGFRRLALGRLLQAQLLIAGDGNRDFRGLLHAMLTLLKAARALRLS